MGHGFLYEALPFLNDLTKEELEQFVEYFRTAPLWLIDSFRIEKVKKGTVFTREGDPRIRFFSLPAGRSPRQITECMGCPMITEGIIACMRLGRWRS